jgi:hypothetical protein
MKNHIKSILFFLLILVSGVVSSCEEEMVEPVNTKDGNITGMDDWYKHNV